MRVLGVASACPETGSFLKRALFKNEATISDLNQPINFLKIDG